MKVPFKIQTILFLLAIGIMSMLLPGCFGDPIQDDLVNYLKTESPPLYEEESRIGKDFDSVAGDNYTDDATMHAMLKDHVVPDFQDFVKKLEKVSLKTVEVRDAHQKWIDAAKTRLQSYQTLQTALEKGDEKGVQEANAQYDAAVILYQEHLDAVKNLARAHNVTLTK